MSLAHASDPSARASRLVCEVPSCRRTEAPTLVRLFAPGRRFPESRWLCRYHHKEARDEGLTEESAMLCPVTSPRCRDGRMVRGLCTYHYGIANRRALLPKSGPIEAGGVDALRALEDLGPLTVSMPAADLTRTTSADDDAPINPEAIAALELPPIQRPRIRPAMPAPERAQPESQPISPIDPLLQAYEERDLWQRREAAAVERARTAERERDEALAMHERGWQAARKAGHQEAARALLLALDRQPWSLDGLDSELNLSLVAAIATATSDEQGSELLKTARAERDAAAEELAALRAARADLSAIDAALDENGAPDLGDKVKTRADRIGALIGHWQDGIYQTVRSMVPYPDRIDGSGSDAGPLELTEAEVAQGLAQLIDAQAETAADLERAQREVEELRADLRGEPGSIGIADAALIAEHDVRQNAAMVAALDEMRTERDEARAESSSHLQFIDALLAVAGWKRGEDDSDAAKIAHVGQIIAERASWKESWQRRAQQLAQALGKLPEDVSYQECLAIVRDQREDRDVWNQRVATMMEALPRHLFAGGERLDQMVVGVCELLRRAEETVQPLATRYRTTSLGAIVGAAMLDLERLDAVTTALDQLGAPDAEVGADGVPDSTPATRIGLLIRYWQDAIRSALPGDVDSVDGGGCGGSALDLTLAEIAQGLENAREGDRAGAPPAIEAPSLFQRLVTATPDGGRLIAVEMALDEAKAPAAESLVERIRLLVGAHAQELAEATERADARESELLGHLGAIREALNVGPPSASDVPAGTPWAEVAWIVRARSELMLEERDQRVALGQLVERIAKSTGFATGPLLGQYGPLEEHIRGLAKEAACAARQEEWLAEHLADSTPVLRALVADGCGFVEPLASLIAERAVPAGPGHGPYNERLAVARLFATHLLSDPCPF